jgi:hypothetical protein
MSTEPHKPSSDLKKTASDLSESSKWESVMIARVVGILCVAGGFVLGLEGLDNPDSPLLPTALGLIVAGVVAQVFALLRSWYVYVQRKT